MNRKIVAVLLIAVFFLLLTSRVQDVIVGRRFIHQLFPTKEPRQATLLSKQDQYADEPWVREFHQVFADSSFLEWYPYVHWRTKPLSCKYVHVDAQGIRRTWNSEDSKLSPFTIYMFGGSTMFGLGVRDEYTIASILSKLLTEKGKFHVRIINFGQPGYFTTQEVIALLLELQHGQIPDLVLYYDGINDSFYAFENGEANLPMGERALKLQVDLLNDVHKKFLNDLVVMHLWRKMLRVPDQGNLHRVLDPNGKIKLAKEVASVYVSNVNLVQNLASARNFHTLFYWQPVIFTKRNLSPYESMKVEENMKYKERYSFVYDQVKHSDYLNGLSNFHNIASILDDEKSPVYLDQAHLSERGNEIIARRMYVDVVKILKGTKKYRQNS